MWFSIWLNEKVYKQSNKPLCATFYEKKCMSNTKRHKVYCVIIDKVFNTLYDERSHCKRVYYKWAWGGFKNV